MSIHPSRYIIVARHCDDSENDGFLSDFGEDQADRLATNICRLLKGRSATVIASTTNRAVETAEIIAHHLGIKTLADECLFSESRCELIQLQEIERLINRYYYGNQNMNVIVVTHMEVTEQLPNFYAREFPVKTVFSEIALPKGNGWVIDRPNMTIGSISPTKPYNPNIIADRIRWQLLYNHRYADI